MRILILGGTRLTGPHVVHELAEAGHEVTVFHRGQTEAALTGSAGHMHGDRGDIQRFVEEFKRISPDAVIDMLAFTGQDAELLMQTFKGMAGRVVVASSIDVYRAFGRLHGTELGAPDPVPLTEEAPLRSKLSVQGEAYEKRWVEEVVLNDPDLPGTALRLPAIYGPGDYRPYYYLKRMSDGRPFILLDERLARWQFSRGYAENVAHAIVLAAINPRATGRIYNVADEPTLTQIEWIELIARAAGWDGEILTAPRSRLPDHLVRKENLEQHWVVDTSRIREELGFAERIDAAEAMRRTLDWIQMNPLDPDEEQRLFDPQEYNYPAEDEALRNLEED
jgi:nucleoside-diphosphate-sugar epimerase